MSQPELFRVSARRRQPILDFFLGGLEASGCVILHCSPTGEAPWRISFLTPWGERLGVVAYLFLANTRTTRNRPVDEHRFQLKYGSKDGKHHDLWQDPYGLYTTLCIGVNPELGFFVGIDPVLNSPTLLFISKEFKQHHAEEILASGWHIWERDVRAGARRRQSEGDGPEYEIMVGGTAENLLAYILFEREAVGEDQGHRHLIAERFPDLLRDGHALGVATMATGDEAALHALEREFELPHSDILELIAGAPRLKMAVRGWVAERHLRSLLEKLPDVTKVSALEQDGRPDFEVRVRGGRRPVLVECKNVLRASDAAGRSRLDFMKTRASIGDRCSRYYSARDFDIVAACLHPRTERWEFVARQTSRMKPHATCTGKLHHRIIVDESWSSDLGEMLRRAAA